MWKKKKKNEDAPQHVNDGQDNGYYGGYFPQDAYNNAYYGGQYVQPLDASALVEDARASDPNLIIIVPGRDGVPYNITNKGIENLTRIERLRRNGVISDANYNVMREKILSMFVQHNTF